MGKFLFSVYIKKNVKKPTHTPKDELRFRIPIDNTNIRN